MNPSKKKEFCIKCGFDNTKTTPALEAGKDLITRAYYVCSECRHENTIFEIQAQEMRINKKVEGVGGYLQRVKYKKTFSGETGNDVLIEQVVDRENDKYIKKVKDLKTGEYLKNQEIALSSKNKKKSPSKFYKRGHNKKHTTSYIKSIFEDFGYRLLSKYINCGTKMVIKCPEGHLFSMCWNDFQQGNRCPICFGSKKKTIKQINDFVSKEGYVCISKEYKNAAEKLKFRCPENHIFMASWNNFSGKKGSRCPICWSITNRGKDHHNWKGGKSFEPYCEIFSDKEFRDFIKQRDGNICLNPACNNNSNLLSIHHIDYNKKNCNHTNLILLCASCNSKANIDRNWHRSWYRAILFRRYGYKEK